VKCAAAAVQLRTERERGGTLAGDVAAAVLDAFAHALRVVGGLLAAGEEHGAVGVREGSDLEGQQVEAAAAILHGRDRYRADPLQLQTLACTTASP
jgi:hypothetical protein